MNEQRLVLSGNITEVSLQLTKITALGQMFYGIHTVNDLINHIKKQKQAKAGV